MACLTAFSAFVFIRTSRRFVTLDSTQIADQGLTPIPYTASITIDGNRTRGSVSENERHQPRASKDILIKEISLLFDSLYIAKITKTDLIAASTSSKG